MRYFALIIVGFVHFELCRGFFGGKDKNKNQKTVEINSNAEPITNLEKAFDDKIYHVPLSSINTSISNGYISAEIIDEVENIPFLFKISSRVDQPAYPCKTIEFTNIPNPNPSPFVNGEKFTLLKEMYNGRFAWTNGKEFVSFVPGDGLGTWIVGVNPGEDSGYIYLKPKSDTLVPITDPKSKTASWHWLDKRRWTPYPDASVVCREDVFSLSIDHSKTQSFYNIEYFDVDTKSAYDSYFIYSAFSFGETRIPTQTEGMYYDIRKKSWRPLRDLKLVASIGEPNLIRQSSTGQVLIGHLVNEEHASDGYRLTYRLPKGFNQTKNEIFIIYNRFGSQTQDFKISSLPMDVSSVFNRNLKRSFASVKRGEYIWLWYRTDSQDASSSVILNSGLVSDPYTVRHDEVLLECISTSPTKVIFKHYVSDRVKTMHQTVLEMDTTFVELDRTNPIDVKFTYNSIELQIVGGFFIGSDVIGFIKQYLKEKEGQVNGLSSCYFYHAAVSLPRPLVYAAEIMCVLIGSKPVTMIQYVTPSDHQWKFPLVSKLTRHLISMMKLYPELIDLNSTVTTLGKDQTLIFYRPNRQYLVDSLKPSGQAQALHPGPYIDPNNALKSNEEQIYNAYWNGIVLGYPQYFVESYCRSFHNDLSSQGKSQQILLAQHDVGEYFTMNGLEKITIKAGLDLPVHESIWNDI